MIMPVDSRTLQRDWGIALDAKQYLPDEFKSHFELAMDAQPVTVTQPNSGVPFWLTQYVDPEYVRILQAPNVGAEILGERLLGDWTTTTVNIPVVENTGEVSSYGDFNNNGRSDANMDWAFRQSYKFQTIVEIGDFEVDQVANAKLNWVSEVQTSAASTLAKYADYTYHFGVSGLNNYGILNDPNLAPSLTPSTKAAGGTRWVNANGSVNATPNEVYGDVQAMFASLASVSAGRIKMNDPMTLVLPPVTQVGITAANIYNVDVNDLLKKSFTNIKVVVAPRYATTAGNVVQLIADKFDGHETGFCAFNIKSRDFPIVRDLSSFKQKKMGGTFGAIIKYPLAIATMLGV